MKLVELLENRPDGDLVRTLGTMVVDRKVPVQTVLKELCIGKSTFYSWFSYDITPRPYMVRAIKKFVEKHGGGRA